MRLNALNEPCRRRLDSATLVLTTQKPWDVIVERPASKSSRVDRTAIERFPVELARCNAVVVRLV